MSLGVYMVLLMLFVVYGVAGVVVYIDVNVVNCVACVDVAVRCIIYARVVIVATISVAVIVDDDNTHENNIHDINTGNNYTTNKNNIIINITHDNNNINTNNNNVNTNMIKKCPCY